MVQGLGFAGVVCGGMMAWFAYQSTPPQLVRAQSNASTTQPKKAQTILRRHSSGDHAVFPGQGREALKSSQKNFGVPSNLQQDGEGNRLPTTRGY